MPIPWVTNCALGTMPTIETHHVLPAALPKYIQDDCAHQHVIPMAALAELCSMAEPTAVVVDVGSRPVRQSPLLVWLPDARPEQLLALAQTEPLVENHTSADLCANQTYLIWRSSRADTEVRLDTWKLAGAFPVDERELVVIFVGPGHAIAARLCMDSLEAEAFFCELQAAASSSGPNWNPWRIFSEEEMLHAEGQEELTDPGILTPRVFTLTLRR